MKKEQYGQIVLEEEDFFKIIYRQTIDLEKILVEKSVAEQFNSAAKSNYEDFSLKTFEELDLDISEFDKINQNNWFMPKEYKTLDIEGYLVNVCPKENYQRLIDELKLFRQYNMMDLLKFLKYLIDTMKKHNIMWGLGRGSSVASYVLFLLEVHKVNPIEYKLDFREFLK